MPPMSLTRRVENTPELSTPERTPSQSLPIPHMGVNRQWTKVLRNQGTITVDEEVVCFAPRYRLGIESPQVDTLLRELFPTLGNRAKKATRYALQSALLSLYLCDAYDSPMEFTAVWYCTDNGLKFCNNRARLQPYSRGVFSKVMKALASNGYCDRFKGFKAKSAMAGVPSLWRPTPALLQILRDSVPSWEIVKLPTYLQPIRVIDSPKKQLVEYEEYEMTQKIGDEVLLSNRLRQAQRWSYDKPTKAGGIECVYINPHDLEGHRVFHHNLTQHGRFYLPAQQIPSSQRLTMRVNGQPTVEADYKSFQPRILYHLCGLKPPSDCYEPEGRFSRAELKVAMLRALNCESRGKAVKSLRKELGENHAYADRLLKALERQHALIAEHFYKEVGKHLVTLDASIASIVINRMTDLGIPLIPIHDSFIVEQRHAEELIRTMRVAYEVVLRTDDWPDLTVVGMEWDDSMWDNNDDF